MLNMPQHNRLSIVYAERGYLELDGNAVVLRQDETKTHIPVGSVSVVMVEPGTVVTHAAVRACAESGCLLVWVGEAGVRCYSAGVPGGASGERILHQASIRLNDNARLRIAREIFNHMFEEYPPTFRSVEQLRGLEGSRVRKLYHHLADKAGVQWHGRRTHGFDQADPVNQAISTANAALYGLAEAVILALGYSPAIGFVHTGDPRSFVYDVADCVKFSTVVPLSMRVASEGEENIEGRTRRACRDLFRGELVSARLVQVVESLLG